MSKDWTSEGMAVDSLDKLRTFPMQMHSGLFWESQTAPRTGEEDAGSMVGGYTVRATWGQGDCGGT